MVPPLDVVDCPNGFLEHSPIARAPDGAIDPVAGHVLIEGLQRDWNVTLEAVKHRPDFSLWKER